MAKNGRHAMRITTLLAEFSEVVGISSDFRRVVKQDSTFGRSCTTVERWTS